MSGHSVLLQEIKNSVIRDAADVDASIKRERLAVAAGVDPLLPHLMLTAARGRCPQRRLATGSMTQQDW
jgi:hypothetical protein